MVTSDSRLAVSVSRARISSLSPVAGVGAQMVELSRGVFTGPRGLCACVIGPGLGRGGPLVSLCSLCEGLVPGIVSGAHEGLSLGKGLLDRLPRLRFGPARALPGLIDGSNLLRLGPRDRAVPVFLGDGDARLGLLADPLELGGAGAAAASARAVVSFTRPGLRCFCELPGGLRLGARGLGCLIGGNSCLLLCG